MVNLICGQNGSGKTQKLINCANGELENAKGLMVYIDKYDKYRLSVAAQIRFIDGNDFDEKSVGFFYGLLSGLVAGNYDINRIFVDNITTISGVKNSDELKVLLDKIQCLSNTSEVNFVITLNSPDVENIDLSGFECCQI